MEVYGILSMEQIKTPLGKAVRTSFKEEHSKNISFSCWTPLDRLSGKAKSALKGISSEERESCMIGFTGFDQAISCLFRPKEAPKRNTFGLEKVWQDQGRK